MFEKDDELKKVMESEPLLKGSKMNESATKRQQIRENELKDNTEDTE